MKKDILDQIKSLKIKGFEIYSLVDLFRVEVEHLEEVSTFFKIKKFFGSLLLKPLKLNYIINDYESKNLVFTQFYNRIDHDNYWNIFKSLFNNYNEIELNFEYKMFRLDFKIFQKIRLAITVMRALLIKLGIIDCLYLSAKLYDSKEIIRFLEKNNFSEKRLFLFYDGISESNLLNQFFKVRGFVTNSLLHGQPIIFDQRDVFFTDYFIVKGKFSLLQYFKLGYDKKRLINLGDLNSIKVPKKSDFNEKRNFTLYLDSPGFNDYEKVTLMLIRIANELSKSYGYTYSIKQHPSEDRADWLNRVVDKKFCKLIYSTSTKNEEIIDQSDFSIVHRSSVFTDLILMHQLTLIYSTAFNMQYLYPKELCFKDIEKIMNAVHNWNSLSHKEKINKFDSLNEYYSYPINILDRYNDYLNLQ